MKKFIKTLSRHFKGHDLGFQLSPMFIGEIPAPQNRAQRRVTAKRYKKVK